MEPTVVEERELIRFERAEEYFILLGAFLQNKSSEILKDGSVNIKDIKVISEQSASLLSKEELLSKMSELLDEYQEQPYLLDPHLEEMVHPPVHSLQFFVRRSQASSAAFDFQVLKEQEKIASLIYCYTKVRGYKTITRFFPHEVADLLPVLNCLETLSSVDSSDSESRTSSWELRYVLLLWLSLVCMIPFDLHKFDSASTFSEKNATSKRIEKIGRVFLSSPGKERDASSVMLGKLFQRRDASESQFGSFLAWCQREASGSPSVFLSTGILQTLCEIVKLSSPTNVELRLPAIQSILDLYSQPESSKSGDTSSQEVSSISKYQTKLACRLGLKLLKPRRVVGRRVKMLGDPALGLPLDDKMKSTHVINETESGDTEEEDDDEEEVPEEVDGYISNLLEGLQHKDTQIRYLSAKSLARLSERLPKSFISQIADAITALFQVNVFDVLGDKTDLSSVSESTWQGACLGIAELGRRGLLEDDEFGSFSERIEWVEKALHFDVRRGSHSVGSGVRDSACYVLWAISRTVSSTSTVLQQHSLSLARSLISVALLDREISIRRAASAAFQECVGRLSLFPHGIDLIRKTDFYSISVRRNSFLECTREVAVHNEYREFLLNHILKITIMHWDSSMRELGSQAAARVIELDLETLGPQSLEQLKKNCKSRDSNTLHGTLLTSAELAKVAGTSGNLELQVQCFKALDLVPRVSLRGLGAAQVLVAACQLGASSVSSAALTSTPFSKDRSGNSDSTFEIIIDHALSRQEEEVQVAASHALGALSSHTDFLPRLKDTIKNWKSLSTAQQQSNSLALGRLDFTSQPEGLIVALEFLMSLVLPKSSNYSKSIETRRNAYDSIAQSLSSVGGFLFSIIDSSVARSIQSVLLLGLEDYTTDQRGDVGSWVRLSCISGLRSLVNVFSSLGNDLLLEEWLPIAALIEIVGGLIKQMVERIDNVREEAGKNLLETCKAVEKVDLWRSLEGLDLLKELFPDSEASKFKDPSWLFPRAARLLSLGSYRSSLLEGLVLVVGSRTEMAHRIVGASLCSFVIPSSGSESQGNFNALELLRSLFNLASSNFSSNRLFVPALQTINLLIEGGAVDELDEIEGKAVLGKILRMITRNIDKIKSVPRVQASMTIVTNLMAVRFLKSQAIPHIPTFLSHSFPTIRAATSEQLYLVLQSIDDPEEVEMNVNEEGLSPQDELEELLLGTAWSSSSPDNFNSEALKIKQLLPRT